jgi:hypothetical protein
MLRALVISVLSISACTSKTFLEGDSGSDASAIDSGLDAARDAGPACNPNKPFGTPQPVSGLGNETEGYFGAHFSSDRLTAWFARQPPNPSNLFTATRLAPDGAFGAATPLFSTSATWWRYFPTLTEDTLTLLYSDDKGQMWKAVRASASAPFAQEKTISPAGVLDGHPHLLPDGSALYFDRTPSQSGASRLFRSPREAGEFMTVVAVPGLENVLGLSPVTTPDELTIYFASKQSSNLDVFVARRASITSPFGAPTPVPELNSLPDDFPTWISADDCEIYTLRYAVDAGIYLPYVLRARRP